MALGNLWHMLLATATVPGDAQTHHAGGQDKGAAGADEAAHQAADKAYDEKK